ILANPSFFTSVKGVIYSKGNYWYKNITPLTKKIIMDDFDDMRKAGVNTIKIYGPNIYDRSIFDAADKKNLKIHYSFWMPDPPNFLNDTSYLKDQTVVILNIINKNKSNPQISAWNLGNNSYQQLAQYYKGAQLQQAQQHYINFLKALVKAIKQADPTRPLTVDLLSSLSLGATMSLLHELIPQIDAFGLIISNKHALKFVKSDLKAPFFFGSADPMALAGKEPSGGAFYANWQDQQSGVAITLDGLKDIWGRNKPYLYNISKRWHGNVADYNLPHVKILKPALTTTPGASLSYNALIYAYNKWNIAGYLKNDLKFEWYLIKTDNWGNTTDMKKLGDGPSINVIIPQNDDRYRIYLVAAKGNNMTDDNTTLNTPLQN
ncbi:MAG TPA: hypothetical protein VIM77_00430, partial [Mucilaginibacter sp.]